MKNRLRVVGVLLCALFSLIGCTTGPSEPKVTQASVAAEVQPVTTVLSTIAVPDNSGKIRPDISNKAGSAPAVVNNISQILFNNSGRGVAYIVEKSGKFHVVHNGATGKPYTTVLTPTLSPDGRHIAYAAYVDDKLRMVIDGKEGQIADEIEPTFFSPDSRHTIYQAKIAGQWYFVVDDTKYPGLQTQHNRLVFSADSKKICYVDSADDKSKPRLVVTDLTFKKQIAREASGTLMVLSENKTRIAASSEINNKQMVIEFNFATPDIIKQGPLYDAITQLEISRDGGAVAYVAQKNGKRVLVLNGNEKPYPDGTPVGPLVIRPDNKGVGFLMSSKRGTYWHQAFYNDGTVEKQYDEVGELVYSKDGSMYAFLARKEMNGKSGGTIFAVVNGKEGPKFDKILRPVFSPDGTRLIYRVRHGGKRFVVVSDTDGKVIRQHPDYEMVFQPVFTADGQYVAYGVKDGNKLIWKVEKLSGRYQRI